MPFSQEYLRGLQEIFIHLHNHSDYSNLRLLDSINKIRDMIIYVSNLGQKALALTDHESLSGHVEFILAVEDLKKENLIPQDFKVILGNEIYLVDEHDMEDEITNLGYTSFYHFILLAKDARGHEMLRELSSRAWKRMFNYKNMDRVPTFYSDFEDIVGDDIGHLIGSTACLGGRFPKLVTKLLKEKDENEIEKIKDKIHDFIVWCLDIFGEEDFYIELQPSLDEEQIEFNKKAIQIAEAYGIEYIITTDSHYLDSSKKEIHEAYLTSNSEGDSNREVGQFYQSTHFFTMKEIVENMSYLDIKNIERAVLNTDKIGDKITSYSLKSEQEIPLTPIKDKRHWFKDKELYTKALEYPYIKQMIESKDNEYNQFLINKSLEGFKEKIAKEDYEVSFKRMNIECKEILGITEAKKKPVSGYFTSMNKMMDIIWEEAEAIVPPGRGSAGAYIIDYLIDITQVNPLKQGVELPHFRFISADRPDYPKIILGIGGEPYLRVCSIL